MALVPTATVGLPRLTMLAAPTTYILIRPIYIRLPPIGTTMVSPSVVLLDNHITNRKIAESYGWKWENKPDYAWESYYANYSHINNYNIELYPFYLVQGGFAGSGSMGDVGHSGRYWSSTIVTPDTSYYLLFSAASVFPSTTGGYVAGYSIRCLAR